MLRYHPCLVVTAWWPLLGSVLGWQVGASSPVGSPPTLSKICDHQPIILHFWHDLGTYTFVWIRINLKTAVPAMLGATCALYFLSLFEPCCTAAPPAVFWVELGFWHQPPFPLEKLVK